MQTLTDFLVEAFEDEYGPDGPDGEFREIAKVLAAALGTAKGANALLRDSQVRENVHDLRAAAGMLSDMYGGADD